MDHRVFVVTGGVNGRRSFRFLIHPTMMEPPLHCIGAVREFSLDPLEIGQARTIGKFVQHPNRKERLFHRQYLCLHTCLVRLLNCQRTMSVNQTKVPTVDYPRSFSDDGPTGPKWIGGTVEPKRAPRAEWIVHAVR